MGGAAQVAMRVASQIWQVVFASQTLQVFCLALRKKAQYVVVNYLPYLLRSSYKQEEIMHLTPHNLQSFSITQDQVQHGSPTNTPNISISPTMLP
jgi:hypothetical protein